MLAGQGGLEPLFHQPLTRPGNRIDAALQRRRDLAVAPAFAGVRGVAFNKMRAFSSFCAGCLPVWIKAVSAPRSSSLRVTMNFFTAAVLFLATNPLRHWGRRHRVREWPRNQ